MRKLLLQAIQLASYWLPVPLLVCLLYPMAMFLGLRDLFWVPRTSSRLKRLNNILPTGAIPVSTMNLLLGRVGLRLNRLMTLWGNQLREPKWASRISCEGIDELKELTNSGRSVLLATVHYGCPPEGLSIMRARGLRAAGLVYNHQVSWIEQIASRQRDERCGLGNAPLTISADDIWGARDFLREPGSLLLMAIDRTNKKKDPSHDFLGGSIRSPLGFERLAVISDALIVPVLFSSTGLLRWRLWFGEAIDPSGHADSSHQHAICLSILKQIEPAIIRRPELIQPELIGSMMPRNTFQRRKRRLIERCQDQR